MILVHRPDGSAPSGLTIAVPVDRSTLATLRWQAIAADGQQFDFDLERPMHNGAIVHRHETIAYVLVQTPEPVLEVNLPAIPAAAAHLAWRIASLGALLQTTAIAIRVADNPTLRGFFEREQMPYASRMAVFHPITAESSRQASHAHIPGPRL